MRRRCNVLDKCLLLMDNNSMVYSSHSRTKKVEQDMMKWYNNSSYVLKMDIEKRSLMSKVLAIRDYKDTGSGMGYP